MGGAGSMKIKKFKAVKWIGLLVLVGLLGFGGLKVYNALKNQGVGFPDTYLLAAFDTTEKLNDTTLTYYDENFEAVFRQKISVGQMCFSFTPPILYDGKIYTAPCGQGRVEDVDEVWEIDKATGKHKKYKTEQRGVAGMAVTERYIFTVNNWNGVPVLARTDKKTGEIVEQEYPGKYCPQIDVYGKRLYCFIMDMKEEPYDTRCSILDIDTLEEEKSFNISEYGTAPENTYMKDGILYMPIYRTSIMEECGLLLMYDTETEKLEAVELGADYACQVLEYNGKLVVTHADLVYANPGECFISIYDPETGAVENYPIESVPDQAVIKGDLLYTLDIMEQSIFVYDLKNKGELKEQHKLESKEGKSSYRYYIGGFFMQ